MPTVLLVRGWRFFFYSNEGQEPPHIHVKRGSAQAKFWLNIESLGVEQAYVRHMTQQEQRQVQQIISAHFEELLDAWQEFEREKVMSSCPVYLLKNVAVDQAGIAFELAGQKIFVSWLATGSERLTEATPTARSLFEIDPDGIGWYWPALDEDLSTSGLLRAAQRADLIQQPQSIYRPESVSETVGQD